MVVEPQTIVSLIATWVSFAALLFIIRWTSRRHKAELAQLDQKVGRLRHDLAVAMRQLPPPKKPRQAVRRANASPALPAPCETETDGTGGEHGVVRESVGSAGLPGG